MTTLDSELVPCSVCGMFSEQQVLTSTNRFGSPDLDLRPPEMERSTLCFWLQECPNCGFVSEDLEKAEKGVEEVMATEGFTSLHRGELAGTLIGRCLKRSLLDEELGNVAAAAEHILWAAWAADDAQNEAAAEYRSKAADRFLTATSTLPNGSKETTTTRTRIIDILRRASRWNEAIGIAKVLLTRDDLDPIMRSVVQFELRLAQARDAARHTVEEAQSK
jgi:hypothetical protein